MRALDTNEQVFAIYDEAIKTLSEINRSYQRTMQQLLDNLLRGVRYEDENGKIRLSYGIDPPDPNFCDAAHAADIVFRKGKGLISEVTVPDTAASLLLWYAKTKGVNANEIIALFSDPDSDVSFTTMEKIKVMKQDFVDLINSCDTEKIADFYFGAFKEFKKTSSLILKCGNLDGLIKSWEKLVQWVGVTAAVQRSLEDEDYHSTDEQKALIQLLNEKLQKQYGQDVSLRDIIACMQIVDFAYSQMLDAEKHEPDYCEKLSNAVRPFTFLQTLETCKEIFSTQIKYPSAEMGKASRVLCCGNNLTSGTTLFISEMKYFAADVSYPALFDLSPSLDFSYADEDSSMLGTTVAPEIVANFIDQKKYDAVIESDEHIMDILARKTRERIPLTYPEIALCSTDINTRFNADSRALYRKIFNMDMDARLSALPEDTRYLVEQYSLSQMGVSIEEYLCGEKVVKSFCRGAYKAHFELIRQRKTTETVCASFHNRFSKLFWANFQNLRTAGVSSRPFDEMEMAFKLILSNNPTYPSGHETEFKRNLQIVADKAGEYISRAEADGKQERSSAIAQSAYILARRLRTFALDTMTQIKRAEEILAKAN